MSTLSRVFQSYELLTFSLTNATCNLPNTHMCLPTVRGTISLSFLVPMGCLPFGHSFAFPFVFLLMVLAIGFYCDPYFLPYMSYHTL